MQFGKGTRVSIIPDIKEVDPAVYQLRSTNSSDAPICLFTDFNSTVNVSEVLGSSMLSSQNLVLDMKATGSKSNGALFRSNDINSECEINSPTAVYYSSSAIPCDATLVEKSFETDMNLNFQNLSVIGLRIILLKVAGFNLFMTLRLWSS